MKIGALGKIMSISNDDNTRINGQFESLFMYSRKHPDETVKSVHVQSNGVVIIETN